MSFSDLKHQKQAVALLQRSLRAGRLAHAYLFIGASGPVRESLARELAKALNCEKGDGKEKILEDGCGKCAACKTIDAGTHADVHWVRPESKSRRISIEKIRELERAVNLKARDGRVKVGVVVGADRLGLAASNAFLKTLEEPPKNCVLLLLTSDPQKLLATIISRCLPVRLGMTSDELSPIQQRALALISSEKYDAGASFVAARYGMLAQLNALLQTLRQEKETEVSAEWEVEKWSAYDKNIRERLEEELEAAIAAEYQLAREEVLTTLLAWHRDVLVMAEGGDEKLLMFPRHGTALKRQASGLDYYKAATNLAAVEQIRQHLDQNIGESLALEVGLLQLKG